MRRRADGQPAAETPELRFYASAVKDAEALIEAAELTGVDGELAVLRSSFHAHIKEHPEDIDLMLRSVRLIAQVVAAEYRMSPARTDEFAEALESVVTRLGVQMFPERFGAL